MSFDITQIHKQDQYSKKYTSRWNAEATQFPSGGPWSEEELKSLILSKFNAAKADLAKANKIEPNEKLVGLVRQIVMNSLVMNTWKPGAKVHITFDGDLPIFKIE